MGLSISLESIKPRYLFLEDVIKSRLFIAYEVLHLYQPYFKLRSLELWKDAPLKSLEGTLMDIILLDEILGRNLTYVDEYLAKYTLDQKQRLIFKFLGEWKVSDVQIDGYVMVFNPSSWRSTYGDIEANVFPTQKFPDLVDLFRYDTTTEKELVDEFLESLVKVKQEILKILKIYIGGGVPSKYDITTLIGAYYKSDVEFIRDCLRTFIEEKEETELKDLFSPYKIDFLVKSLKEVPRFQQFLEEHFIKYKIKKGEAGSITLVGRDVESFKRFYDDLSTEVLKPIANELPDSEYLFGIIRDVIEGKGLKQTKLS